MLWATRANLVRATRANLVVGHTFFDQRIVDSTDRLPINARLRALLQSSRSTLCTALRWLWDTNHVWRYTLRFYLRGPSNM